MSHPPKEQSPQRAREFDWEIWIDEDEAYIQNVDLATNCHLVKVIEYSSYLALRTELEITTQNAMLAGKLADDRIGELESELLDHKAGISHDLFEMVCNERDASDIRIKELEQENEKLKEALKSASHTPHKKGYCTICDALGVSTNE